MIPDLRTLLPHCPECRAVGEPDDHRHKLWCKVRCVDALRAHGYTAAIHDGQVVVLLYGHVWRVAGGTFSSPSLIIAKSVKPSDVAWPKEAQCRQQER